MLTEFAQAEADLVASHPGIWAERKLGFVNEPFHWEWYELEEMFPRLAVCAPREHAKSEIFSINKTAHMAIYQPGSWQFLFSATLEQGRHLMERLIKTVAAVEPAMFTNPPRFTTTDVIFGNWSRVSVGSVGKSMRGIHPDRIVGDDILNEGNTQTQAQRRKMEAWWFGSVGPMAHPGDIRPLQWGAIKPKGRTIMKTHKPTTITMVGTPFHQMDLLMGMRENPIYHFRRYSAVFSTDDLVDGTWAVERN